MCSHTQAAALVWDVTKGYSTFLKASKIVDNDLHSLIGNIWFTGCLWEKRSPDQPREKQNAEKRPMKKRGKHFLNLLHWKQRVLVTKQNMFRYLCGLPKNRERAML